MPVKEENSISRGEGFMSTNNIYATPRAVTNISECFFYHTMNIPGYGHVEGVWDLRESIRDYLGDVDFKGKRVLEIGTASGFLCFHMESQGAEVVAFDLAENQVGDIVPFARDNYTQLVLARKTHVRKLHNAYWFCHRAHESKAKVVYGDVYTISEEIGMVDISTFCCVLLHVRDPFLALQNALRLTEETVIITDVVRRRYFLMRMFNKLGGRPYMEFMPEFKSCYPNDTWWNLNPDIIKRFIGALGFEETEVRYHSGKYGDSKLPLFTVVGRRTKNTRSA
jgi:hypothetical protein